MNQNLLILSQEQVKKVKYRHKKLQSGLKIINIKWKIQYQNMWKSPAWFYVLMLNITRLIKQMQKNSWTFVLKFPSKWRKSSKNQTLKLEQAFPATKCDVLDIQSRKYRDKRCYWSHSSNFKTSRSVSHLWTAQKKHKHETQWSETEISKNKT